jgi:LemA protein
MEMFYFLITLTLILSLLSIIYSKIYNDFQEKILKLKETESEIDETLRKKHDIFININNALKSKLKNKDLKEIEELNEIENIKDENISSFAFYRKLIEYEAKIITKGEEVKNIKKIDEYSNFIDEIDEINIILSAQIKYYNAEISSYSKLQSKFPSNIVAKIAKFEKKTYFDNKNLDDDNKNDFQI